MAIDRSHPKYDKLIKVSNPSIVMRNATSYLGKDNFELFVSNTLVHKYTILNKENGKKINFGNINYEDYTKHGDDIRRNSYLARSGKIKGDWKGNKWSPNNLSRNLLW